MAINYTYPVKGSPVETDEFLIIDSTDKSTKRVSVETILDLGVSEFQAADGIFISYSPTSPTVGSVTLTGDLSATGSPDGTTFLRGDNTWSTAIREINPTVGDPIVVNELNGVVELSLGKVPIAKGGTNLDSLGSAHQVMAVNNSPDRDGETEISQ